MQDQDATVRCVVQIRPGDLDLLQLAQNFTTEVLNGAFLTGLGRGHPELTVHLPPSDPLRSAEGEGPVGDPHVEIQTQCRAFERREGVQVERYGVLDDLVEELLT